ncbi:hypothetical protein [Geobacter sp. AOG2]|uniref:hypothetical protein n=1 Tax=Geobacter sp. AOG2 TaxID=1566347 RepID=UPI001CC372DA|nr:hypothetical protein [Geobacter sp. AOG2]GFE61690.1 hypothetical protein AOG2_22770 [Geobacter sp. AOG2]
MATISIEHLDDIIVFKVFGVLTLDDVADAIKNHYHMVKCHIIWDFTDGSANALTPTQFRQILALANEYRPYNKSGKTAYVSTIDSNFGMTRMFSVMAEIAGLPYPYAAFRSFEDAVKWLTDSQTF